MEPNASLKPSKKFLIRGGIASAVIAILLVVQTSWFKNLFNKNKITPNDTNLTVGEVLNKDSNGNGISDWEEKLWGLDPTVGATNGVSNKTIIEEKRKSLGAQGQDNNLNETDKVARDLFTLTTALGQEGGNQTSAIAEKISEQNFQKNTAPKYSLKDIKTVKTTDASLRQYKETISSIINQNNKEVPEIEAFISGVESGNYASFIDFDKTVAHYKSLSNKLLLAKCPVGVAQYHLQIVNSLYGIGQAFEKMKVLEDNSIVALVGFAEYRDFDRQMEIATANLISYFELYGII